MFANLTRVPPENSCPAAKMKLASLLMSLLYRVAIAAVSERPELALESLHNPAGMCT